MQVSSDQTTRPLSLALTFFILARLPVEVFLRKKTETERYSETVYHKRGSQCAGKWLDKLSHESCAEEEAGGGRPSSLFVIVFHAEQGAIACV